MISMNSGQLLKLFQQIKPGFEHFDFNGVVIDSRKACAGALFVAIKGESFDGHDFVTAAAKKGAVAAVVERALDIAIPQIIVDDCRLALGTLARAWRQQMNAKVVALTGSNGKTTVKEMLGKILECRQPTLKTSGNLNNDIGVPLTLFQLDEKHRFAVIELGANHMQEIRYLVEITQPDVVYVNNARAAHVEGFGSLQNVIRAKGEIYQYCPQQALAVFNEDEDASDYWRSICATENRLSFSMRHVADVSGGYSKCEDGLRLQLKYREDEAQCDLATRGEHNAQNALAAISLGLACGLELQQVCDGLQGFSGVQGRQQFRRGINNSLIIDDSYNANPDSLASAVRVLCDLAGEAWLALGDMAELGEDSMQLHDQAVHDARDAGVSQFFALGDQSCRAADAFGANGHCFTRYDEMAEFLARRLHPEINLLIKGSRAAHMEKLVAALVVNESNHVTGGRRAL
jgi:UDP-N-acetylmuramoyl-tripeptide--D-alanyl-D-alanine ligase